MIVVVIASITAAASPIPGSGPAIAPNMSTAPQGAGQARQVTIPVGAHAAVYGKTSTGQRFGYSYVQGATGPQVAIPATAVAACTVYVSDLVLDAKFYWSGEQVCSDAFGLQNVRSQELRSSWSGWRGYSLWSSWSTPTTNQVVTEYYSTICNYGKGNYDYEAVVEGQATNIGSSPPVASGNILTSKPCGPQN